MDSGLVLYAQPDYIYEATAFPNDPVYSSQWSLDLISAPAAWDITTGTPNVKIAIADTGANILHPDLKTNLATGHYNFISNNNNVYDDSAFSHGNHVASIAGAQANNAWVTGSNGGYMAGVAWDVSMMIVKVLAGDENARPSGTTASIVRGIDYASDPSRGVTAINLSLGTLGYCRLGQDGPPCSLGDYDTEMWYALRRARDRNVVAVCAAGNGGSDGVGDSSDSDENIVNPASIPTDNVIAVAATNRADNLASYSNYGAHRVDIAAPGGERSPTPAPNTEKIIGLKQTYNTSSSSSLNYTYLYGTSQAAPHVTGALALVKSRFPWESYRGIRDRVLMGVDRVVNPVTGQFRLQGSSRTNGRLNLHKALRPRTVLTNLSTRAQVESGDRIMIGGFIIGGSTSATAPPIKVVIRGRGLSLPPLGVARLNNPKIRLLRGSAEVFANNDWVNLPLQQKDDLALYGLTPPHAEEAAMVQTLSPGSYSVFVESENGQFGVGIFEIFQVQESVDQQSRLVNLSTRCVVGSGDAQAIAGMIVGNSDTMADPPDRRLLVRGKGPSLEDFGVPGPLLADPQLEFFDSVGSVIASNDQWTTIAYPLQEELYEASRAPTRAVESVIWPTLRPNSYSVKLQGINSSGIGLIELLEY